MKKIKRSCGSNRLVVTHLNFAMLHIFRHDYEQFVVDFAFFQFDEIKNPTPRYHGTQHLSSITTELSVLQLYLSEERSDEFVIVCFIQNSVEFKLLIFIRLFQLRSQTFAQNLLLCLLVIN